MGSMLPYIAAPWIRHGEVLIVNKRGVPLHPVDAIAPKTSRLGLTWMIFSPCRASADGEGQWSYSVKMSVTVLKQKRSYVVMKMWMWEMDGNGTRNLASRL